MAQSISFAAFEVAQYYAGRIPRLRQNNYREWRCPCPIHSGSNDSFAIQPATGLWYCFSDCGRGGGIIELEMALSGMDFHAAKLAVYSMLGRDDEPFEHRRDWKAEKARREDEDAECVCFADTLIIMSETALDFLGAESPERRTYTMILQSLRQDPLAVYREWRGSRRVWTEAMVKAGESRQERLRQRLLAFIEKTAAQDAA